VAEVSTRSGAELDALIEEATVDTYDEIEAVNGFLAAIDEHLTVPFTTTVLGVEVTVVEIDLTNDSRMVARCVREYYESEPRPGVSVIGDRLSGLLRVPR